MAWVPARGDREEIKQHFSQFIIPSFSKHLLPLLPRPTHFLNSSATSQAALSQSSPLGPRLPKPEMWQGPRAEPRMSSLSTRSNPVLSAHKCRCPHTSPSRFGCFPQLQAHVAICLLCISTQFSCPKPNPSFHPKTLCPPRVLRMVVNGITAHPAAQAHLLGVILTLFLSDPGFRPPANAFDSTFKMYPESCCFSLPFSYQPGPGRPPF